MIIDHQVSFAENPNNRNLLRMGINLFPNMVLTNNMDGISFFFPVITGKVNAVGVASRTIYKVKQKWKGLFSIAKKEFRQQKKAQRKTGSGPAPGQPSDTSKMIVEVYDNTLGFSVFQEVLSPVSTAVTIILHEGTPTVTGNLWKKFFSVF